MPGSTTGPSVSLRQPKPCGTAWPRQKMVPVSYLSTKCLGSQANPIFSVLCTAVIPLRVHISSSVAVQEVEGGRKTASGFSSAVLQAPDTDPGEERLPPAQPQAFSSHPFLCTCLQTTRCLAGTHRAARPPCSSLPHWH